MNKERLLKMADFLDNLPAEKWDFSSIISKMDGYCGSVCCAVGWLPKVFPDLAYWGGKQVYLRLKDNEDIFLYDPEEYIFDISRDESRRLFFSPANGKEMDTTTSKDVADRIREFIKSKESNQ